MTTITDVKLVYPEFKLFKNIYTRLKIAESVTFFYGVDDYQSSKNQVSMAFSKDSNFYRVSGKLLAEGIFIDWLKSHHVISLKIEDMNLLAKCLKKNVKSVEYNDDKFVFNFLSKDGEDMTIELVDIKVSPENTYRSPFEEIEFIEYEIQDPIIKNDLVRLYKIDAKSTNNTKTENIAIELPRTTILSYQKDGKHFIKYTKFPDKDKKYVEIRGETEDLILTQLFATI